MGERISPDPFVEKYDSIRLYDLWNKKSSCDVGADCWSFSWFNHR